MEVGRAEEKMAVVRRSSERRDERNILGLKRSQVQEESCRGSVYMHPSRDLEWRYASRDIREIGSSESGVCVCGSETLGHAA